MKVLVYGATQVGQDITHYFSKNNHDIILLHEDAVALAALETTQDIQTQVGNPCHPSTLQSIAFDDVDVFCAVSTHDEGNILSAQLVKHYFKNAYVLLYLRNPEYNTAAFQEILTASVSQQIDAFISPESVIADYVLTQLQHPGITRLFDVGGLGVYCWSVMVGQDASAHNLNCAEYIKILQTTVNSASENGLPMPFFMKREDMFLKIKLSEMLEIGDELFFVGPLPKQLPQAWVDSLSATGIQKIALLGGGKIGRRIAERTQCLVSSAQVVVVEADAARAAHLSGCLEDALIIHGNALDVEILKEAKVGDADVVYALMNDDENNIFSCLLGKSLGAKHATALVGNAQYQKFVQNIQLDCLIDPHELTLTAILQALPAPRLKTLTVFNMAPYVLLYSVMREKATLCYDDYGRLLEIVSNVVVVREGAPMVPTHNTLAAPGDHVIVLMHNEKQSELEKLL